MRLIKENSALLWRFFVNHIGMMILGCLLSTVGAEYDNIFLFMSIFNICFYMALVYIAGWDQGAKDVIRADAGRIPRRPWLGFLISAASSFVTVFFLLLLIIGYLFGYGVVSTDAGMGIFGIARIVMGFWQAPYLGVANTILPTTVLSDGAVAYAVFGVAVTKSAYFLALVFFYFLSLFPAILCSGVGYLFGYRNFRLFGFGANKKEKKPSDKRR